MVRLASTSANTILLKPMKKDTTIIPIICPSPSLHLFAIYMYLHNSLIG